MIVVDEFKFWLQRADKDNDHDNEKPKVWILHHVLEKPDQDTVVFQIVDKHDWDLLADREDCVPEEAPKEQVQWANRLVYRPDIERVDGEDS